MGHSESPLPHAGSISVMCFVHIPRTGGNYLLSAYGLHNVIPESPFQYFNFLREPVARTISEFLWLIRLVSGIRESQSCDLAHRYLRRTVDKKSYNPRTSQCSITSMSPSNGNTIPP
jgi:hypothetical protein